MSYVKVLFLLVPIISITCKRPPVFKTGTASDNNSLLWKVEGNHSKPLYLYGTFHMMCKKDIQISPVTSTVITEADKVFFELDMDDPASLLGSLLFINMQKDSSLKQLLPADDYLLVKKYFEDSLHLPFAAFERMKPALLSTFLYPSFMDCRSYSGVEESLLNIIKPLNKDVHGLETIE